MQLTNQRSSQCLQQSSAPRADSTLRRRAGRTLVATLLLIGSASAMAAAPGLTPQQCHDYPFTQLKGEVTHQQLMRELGELEAVGYDPDDTNTYPDDLQQAEQKLQTEYRADCLPAASRAAQAATGHMAANGAASAGSTGAAQPVQAATRPAG